MWFVIQQHFARLQDFAKHSHMQQLSGLKDNFKKIVFVDRKFLDIIFIPMPIIPKNLTVS